MGNPAGKLAVAAALLATAPVYAQSPAAQAENLAMEIAGPVLVVTDLQKSLKFFVEGLGLEVGARLPGNPGPGATVTSRAVARSPFLLLRQQAVDAAASRPIVHGDGLSRIMLVVPDSTAAAARLDAAGYAHTPVNERHVFFVSDPDGYKYEIMQRDSRH